MRLISIAAALLITAGCSPSSPPPKAAIDLERQRAEEVRLQQEADARLREQEQRVSRWQFAAFLAVSAAGIALIVGTILGSRARHDADQ